MHCHPPRPSPSAPHGYLMQRILCCECVSIPCLHACLCFNDAGLCRLNSVCFSGAAPRWQPVDETTVRVTIPLTVHASDSCGRECLHPATVDADVCLPRRFVCGPQEPGVTVLMLPCVQLLHSCPECGGCFSVQLKIALECCLLRCETTCPQPPSCPRLPLYPQPRC